MPDYLGADQRKTKEEEKDDKPIRGQLTQAGAPSRSRTRLGPGGEARFPLAPRRCVPFLPPMISSGAAVGLPCAASVSFKLVEVLCSSPAGRHYNPCSALGS